MASYQHIWGVCSLSQILRVCSPLDRLSVDEKCSLKTQVIPLYGVFIETLGRKFAMVTACLFFGTGTIMCALAGNMYSLIGARTFAGVCSIEIYYIITHPAG